MFISHWSKARMDRHTRAHTRYLPTRASAFRTRPRETPLSLGENNRTPVFRKSFSGDFDSGWDVDVMHKEHTNGSIPEFAKTGKGSLRKDSHDLAFRGS